MPLVTISASYGAGGAAIAPDVAQRLGVPFLDRAIPSEVARRLSVSEQEALAHDETASRGASRLIAALASVGAMLGAASPHPGIEADEADEDAFRRATEEVIQEFAATGQAVILGRAAALVLHGDPRALHVRLDGPEAARVRQAARLAGVDHDEAERLRRANDKARQAYVRHFYQADPRDPAHYHLTLDTTALDWERVADIIVDAARALAP